MWVTFPEIPGISCPEKRQQLYCALDCTGTREVWDTLYPRLSQNTKRTYAFERALQAPALAMMRRGVRVDTAKRTETILECKRELRKEERAVDKLPAVHKIWDGKEKDTGKCKQSSRKDGKHKWPRGVPDTDAGKKCVDCDAPRHKRSPYNANSPPQTKHLLYDLLGAPRQRGRDGEITSDEDALRRIAEKSELVRPVCESILEVRDLKKQLGFLNGKLSPDNRYMASFKVGTTWTGRFASSKSPLGGGGNMQNIAPKHRFIFCADAGYEIAYADLERAESEVVAYLSGDGAYLEAHEGDTHTFVARLIFPQLPWTGNLEEDKKIATGSNPPWAPNPGHNWRFQAKRIQHGGNYGLSPQGISMVAKIPLEAAKKAYYAYHDAFPHIKGWQNSVKAQVEACEPIVNPLGRTVQLYGRPWDPHTYKQGLAFGPQSLVADLLNLSLWHAWRHHDPSKFQVLAQIHDAIMVQWERGTREVAEPALLDCMTIECPITDYRGTTRTMVLGVEAKVGLNWGDKSEANPRGLA